MFTGQHQRHHLHDVDPLEFLMTYFCKISTASPLFVMLLCFWALSACSDTDSTQNADEPDPGTTTSGPTFDENGRTPVEPPPPIIEMPSGPLAGRSPMRLMTRYEYDNTVTDLFGIISTEARLFPPENTSDGFENNAWLHKVTPSTLRYYLDASENLSERVLIHPPVELEVCVGQSVSVDMCKASLRPFIGRAFRRAPSDDEVELFQLLYETTALAESSAQIALKLVVQTILQSPQFLYRIELFEPSPMELAPRDGGMNMVDFELVGPYEIASRLSYFMWNSMPDDALFEAAATGTLNTPAGLKTQVARMMADPRVKPMVYNFHRQWLGFNRVESIIKDPGYFPEWEDTMREDMRLSLEAFIDHVYWDQGTLDAFLTSPAVFLTPGLAPLYGQDVQEGGGLWRADFPTEERSGILTQPALLTILSYPNQSSPINRAVFLREKLLCQHLSPPPANLEIIPPDPDPGLTTRETFAIHTEDDTCAGCHVMIDPLGFGFEGYDGIGRFRTKENGKTVDVSGELIASPDRSINGEFVGAVELAKRLATSEKVAECVADQWFTFAMGRHSDSSDEPSMERIYRRFSDSGYQFGTLFEAIVLSDAFRYRKKREIADAEAKEDLERQEATP